MTSEEWEYIATPVEDHELEKLAAEVWREFGTFQLSAGVLLKADGPLHPGIRNVFVESLNVHARALVAFFGDPLPTRPSHIDDVVALHYVPDWNVGRDGHVDLAWLRSALVPGINKRLAHITAYRVRVSPDWDAQRLIEIVPAMAGLMGRFLARLTPERRRWFAPDGRPPDVGWIYRDVLGIEVDTDLLNVLLGVPPEGP